MKRTPGISSLIIETTKFNNSKHLLFYFYSKFLM